MTLTEKVDAIYLKIESNGLGYDTVFKNLIVSLRDPIPMILNCPCCGERHIDEGDYATLPHKDHACQKCGVPVVKTLLVYNSYRGIKMIDISVTEMGVQISFRTLGWVPKSHYTKNDEFFVYLEKIAKQTFKDVKEIEGLILNRVDFINQEVMFSYVR